MKIILMCFLMFNTYCVDVKKEIKNTNEVDHNYNCDIDIEKIDNKEYLKLKLDDLNSEYTDCIEVLFSHSKSVFNTKNSNTEKNYLKAIEFVYDNSNSHSALQIEELFLYSVFYNNMNFTSNYLYDNHSSLVKCIQIGIASHYSVFEGQKRDEKYNALYDRVSNEIKNKNHREYMIKLLDDIDRNLYD